MSNTYTLRTTIGGDQVTILSYRHHGCLIVTDGPYTSSYVWCRRNVEVERIFFSHLLPVFGTQRAARIVGFGFVYVISLCITAYTKVGLVMFMPKHTREFGPKIFDKRSRRMVKEGIFDYMHNKVLSFRGKCRYKTRGESISYIVLKWVALCCTSYGTYLILFILLMFKSVQCKESVHVYADKMIKILMLRTRIECRVCCFATEWLVKYTKWNDNNQWRFVILIIFYNKKLRNIFKNKFTYSITKILTANHIAIKIFRWCVSYSFVPIICANFGTFKQNFFLVCFDYG